MHMLDSFRINIKIRLPNFLDEEFPGKMFQYLHNFNLETNTLSKIK